MSTNPPSYDDAVRDGEPAEVRIAQLETNLRALQVHSGARISELETDLRSLRTHIERLDREFRAYTREPACAEQKIDQPEKAALSVAEIILIKRVTNAMLYLRYAFGHNLDGLRAKYVNHNNTALMSNADSRITSSAPHSPCSSEEEYTHYELYGSVLWKIMSEPQRDEIRDQFASWKRMLVAVHGIDLDKAARTRTAKK